MDFRCKEQIFIKIVSDPMAEESKWLPACAALSNSGIIFRSPAQEEQSRSLLRSIFSTTRVWLQGAVLSIGQIFMVAAAACSCGCLASVVFGQSYQRVMYHCGPQDTIIGVFTIFALPFFWTGWFLHRHKKLKLALLAAGLPLAYLLGTVVSGVPAIIVGMLAFLLLTSFLYCASYLASFKVNWPRKFRPTLWLSIAYLAAVSMFAFEFAELDLAGTVERARPSSLWFSALTLSAFALVPAFLTALSSGSKRFASGIGLAIIGQLPVLATTLIYCLANAVMLACLGIAGPSSLGEYFAGTVPAGVTPDFDLSAGNLSELSFKLICSALVWLSLVLSLCAGAAAGVLFNRRKSSRLLKCRLLPKKSGSP